MNTMSEAFVYCWTDRATNKLYVGSHKGSTDDGYVCSSKHMLKEYRERPADFSRQIVAEGLHSDMRKFEGAILKSVNAKVDEQFYNKHNNDGLYFDGWSSDTMTEEHKRNIGKAGKGRKLSPEHACKLHEGRKRSKNSPKHAAAVIASRLGSKHSDEIRKKMSEAKLNNPETKTIASNAGRASQKSRSESGYYQSEEWKEKMRLAWVKRRTNKSKTTGGIR
jgi:hypothetical protein